MTQPVPGDRGPRNQPHTIAHAGGSQSAKVPPRAPDSGFRRTMTGTPTPDESHFLPGQGLADPALHPDHPDVIVNQPYGSPAGSLDPETGRVTAVGPKPEDLAPAQREKDGKHKKVA